MRYPSDDYTPWSFFIPMVLAVAIGILLADGVKLFIAGVMLKSAASAISQQITTPGHLPARPGVIEQQPTVHEDQPVQRLLGPIGARQRGISRACIGGHIVNRENNGWSEDMSTGKPQVCAALTP